jgi:hypothetical protein
MIGRGNRVREVFEGSLNLIGSKGPVEVMERLRKNGVMGLIEQEHLLNMMECKHKD